jgi:chromosome segregation ATPase
MRRNTSSVIGLWIAIHLSSGSVCGAAPDPGLPPLTFPPAFPSTPASPLPVETPVAAPAQTPLPPNASTSDKITYEWTAVVTQQKQVLGDLQAAAQKAQADREERIARLRAELEATTDAARTQALTEEIRRLEGQLDTAKASSESALNLKQRDFELDRQMLRQKIQDRLQAELTNLQSQATQKQREADDARTQKSQAEEAVSSLTAQLPAKAQEAVSQNQQYVASVQQNAAEYQSRAGAIQAEIDSFNQQIAATNYISDQDRLKGRIATKKQEIDDLRGIYQGNQDRLVQDFQSRAGAVAANLTQMKTQLTQAQTALQTLPATLAAAEQAVTALNAQIADIQQAVAQAATLSAP